MTVRNNTERGRERRNRPPIPLKWILALCILTVILGIAGAAMAKDLVPYFTIPEDYQDVHKRGSDTYTHIVGPTRGVTCTPYTFQVFNEANEDAQVQSYNHVVAILDDEVNRNIADTQYSVDTTEDTVTYTFYTPGDYVIFSKRYDVDITSQSYSSRELYEHLVWNGGYSNVQMMIHIDKGTGDNPLSAAVQSAKAWVTARAAETGGDDFAVAVAINDYLANLLSYDYSYTYYSAEAALVSDEHICVCNGYSRSYKLIAAACGLPCVRVTGTANNGNGSGWGGHAWDAVRINGNWYEVDPTWNDPTISGGGGNSRYWHIYMGLSDSVLKFNHKGPLSNGVPTENYHFPEGNAVTCSTLEDNYFIHTGKWTDLAYSAGRNETSAMENLQTELNRTSGDTATVTANLGSKAWLEGGSEYALNNYSTKEAYRRINGHIIAWAVSRMQLSRTTDGTETPLWGTFTYSYENGESILSGEVTTAGTMPRPRLVLDALWESGNLSFSVVPVEEAHVVIELDDGQRFEDDWEIGEDEISDKRIEYTITVSISREGRIPSSETFRIRRMDGYNKLILPDALTALETEAFRGVAAEMVIIPDGITRIEEDTFTECNNLEAVYIPDGVTYIDPGAFSTDGLMIYGKAGSAAEDFADASETPTKCVFIGIK